MKSFIGFLHIGQFCKTFPQLIQVEICLHSRNKQFLGLLQQIKQVFPLFPTVSLF